MTEPVDMFLYRLIYFETGHENAQIIETKLKNVFPMAYGYFYEKSLRVPRPFPFEMGVGE